jgi:hypothetical protein
MQGILTTLSQSNGKYNYDYATIPFLAELFKVNNLYLIFDSLIPIFNHNDEYMCRRCSGSSFIVLTLRYSWCSYLSQASSSGRNAILHLHQG